MDVHGAGGMPSSAAHVGVGKDATISDWQAFFNRRLELQGLSSPYDPPSLVSPPAWTGSSPCLRDVPRNFAGGTLVEKSLWGAQPVGHGQGQRTVVDSVFPRTAARARDTHERSGYSEAEVASIRRYLAAAGSAGGAGANARPPPVAHSMAAAADQHSELRRRLAVMEQLQKGPRAAPSPVYPPWPQKAPPVSHVHDASAFHARGSGGHFDAPAASGAPALPGAAVHSADKNSGAGGHFDAPAALGAPALPGAAVHSADKNTGAGRLPPKAVFVGDPEGVYSPVSNASTRLSLDASFGRDAASMSFGSASPAGSLSPRSPIRRRALIAEMGGSPRAGSPDGSPRTRSLFRRGAC